MKSIKPMVVYNSRGPEGNIYCILGLVGDALKKQSRREEFNTLRDKVLNSKSYEEALGYIREIVELKDKAK